MTDPSPSSTESSGSGSDDNPSIRGQSNVIAVVLLVGLTLTGATVVMLVGSTALDSGQQQADLESAESSLAQVNVKASRITFGTNNTEQVVVGDGDSGTTRVEPNAGEINVTLVNQTTGDTKEVLLNDSLGRIVYELDGERVAFQGGGVWRETGENGSRMLSRPDVHYRNDAADQPTVTIPLTLIEGTGGTGNELTLSNSGTDLRYPVRGDENRTNPVTSNTRINLTVQSDYYRAWGDYFADLTDGKPAYDHDERRVSIALITPSDKKAVSKALYQTSPDADLEFDSNAMADSYNSSQGSYADTTGDNGTIATAGAVKIQSNGELHGDIVAGDYVEIDSASTHIFGNVSYQNEGDTEIHHNADVDGWTAANATIDPVPSVEGYVVQTFDRVSNASRNDNDKESEIDGESIDFGDDNTATLHGADGGREYYVSDDLDLSGKKLVLDTTDGEIRLAIAEDLSMDGGNITVRGEHTGRIYLKDDFDMSSNAVVHVPGDNSTQMWVYGMAGSDVDFDGNSMFTGVVYIPAGDGISVDSNAQVFGGVVGGGDADIQSSAQLHYDEALTGIKPIPRGRSVPQITHLHLSVNYVEVEAD